MSKFNLDQLPQTIDSIISKLEANRKKVLFLTVTAFLFLFVFVVVFVSHKATAKKIEAYEAKIQENNKRLSELDGVLGAVTNELSKLQHQEHQLEVQLDSVRKENLTITQKYNSQISRNKKLKQELYYEKHKNNYSDSTIISIIQGFSE